ncbi:Translation machinery-associated protein 64 [Grifola frondosa]|uniref:Translation machinery-associated protein 64 n=1 Tax=Grifola frondosa TaxID=5627 RepID=A0A1C7MDJ9_GRIFR|nr:Translation machinery-associated protein 64 [Grifola frondosa]
MFKKPLAELKTSAPLRSSDRRRLKQRVLQTYELEPEAGDFLVPDGLLSQKFSTHLDEPGVAYLSPEGDPLWFTIGKGSDDLIPSIYTLWKRPDLLPFLSTPAAVVPKLIGGADLMIPGGEILCIVASPWLFNVLHRDPVSSKQVIQHTSTLAPDQLVSITQYHHDKLGYPLAVGRMAISSDTLKQAEKSDVKGKAVYVWHTWKDSLWEMGDDRKLDVPEPRPLAVARSGGDVIEDLGNEEEAAQDDTKSGPPDEGSNRHAARNVHPTDTQSLTIPKASPQNAPSDAHPDADDSSHPDSRRCVRVTHAWTAHRSRVIRRCVLLPPFLLAPGAVHLPIIPPTCVVSHPCIYVLERLHPSRASRVCAGCPRPIGCECNRCEALDAQVCQGVSEGLCKRRSHQAEGKQRRCRSSPPIPAVVEHRPHRTVKDVEKRNQKAQDRERKDKEEEEKRKGEIQVAELWKPFGSTVGWFVAAEKDTSDLYTLSDIKATFNAYVATKNLINARDQQYINVGNDPALLAAATNKNEDAPEFLKREDVLGRLRDHMQSWYEIRVEGQDVIRKKGQLKPVSVVTKMRQGRKACTLVTGFEVFSLNADEMAEELRRTCASSTAVSPITGKTSGMEVMVQGRQVKAVTDFLISRGVPKKWIESADMTAEKKKK